MGRRLEDISIDLLLHFTRGISYLTWGLGFLLGVATAVPRIMELKGQPLESSTVFAVMAGVLIATVSCIFIHSRLVNEVERRLSAINEKQVSR